LTKKNLLEKNELDFAKHVRDLTMMIKNVLQKLIWKYLGIYEFPKNILSPEGKEFLEKLLATNPEDRMTAFEAFNHPG